MVRIGDLNPNDPGKVLPGIPPVTPRPDGPRTGFAQQYASTQAGSESQTFEELVYQVDKQGQMLMKSPTPAQVASYRDAVRRYLKEVSDKLGRVDKKTDRRNRTMVILRELDDKLASLTDAILKSQMSSIDLSASVNEIRGLLMDLFI